MPKGLPIGIEFFKTMRDNDYYYVDKTMMITELLDRKKQYELIYQTTQVWKDAYAEHVKDFL